MATLVGEQTWEANSGRRTIWLCDGTARSVCRLVNVGAGTAPFRRTETESKAGVVGAMPWTRRCRVAICKGGVDAQGGRFPLRPLRLPRPASAPTNEPIGSKDGPAAMASFGLAFYRELIAPYAVLDDREARQDF